MTIENSFDIQRYLVEGVESLMRDVLRATLSDPRESAFMTRFAAASALASKRRENQEKEGLHVPSFLIASITSSCNLHCAGCYSRANHATEDCAPKSQLTSDQWLEIFSQAQKLGVSFILLAGGEPLLRPDIIECAGKMGSILFPIFTNGILIDNTYLNIFDKYRNLFPILSIEGDRGITGVRRGAGVYDKLMRSMEKLQQKGLLFGCSITVTTENLDEVLSDTFVQSLAEKGCKVVFYIKYVPVTEEAAHLAPGDKEREIIKTGINRLRTEHNDIVFVSFPGDEKASGGCLAAGRGFFHINSHGGAEPCPFSPYSDINVVETSLKDALNSKLFLELRDGGYLLEDHAGGCVLYEKQKQVEEIVSRQ
ncbi:MAG: radical SAM protein [Coriobacteriales bacterium]|nr:radical SAM protein [Coriobacteriales bacterium]